MEEALRHFALERADAVVVDDLLPGLQMAQAAGVDFAGACWCHGIPQIRQAMADAGCPCFANPGELWKYLYKEGED